MDSCISGWRSRTLHSVTKHTRHKAEHFMCYRTRVLSLAETCSLYLQNKVVFRLSVLTFLVTSWPTEKLLTREESFCSMELNNIYQVMSWYCINCRSSVLKTYSPRNFDILRGRLSRSYVRDSKRVPFEWKVWELLSIAQHYLLICSIRHFRPS
jgi:hypothetical protein